MDIQSYESFRDAIQQVLMSSDCPMTWTAIRTQAGLEQKFPNNQWVRRMEQDIGLVRAKARGQTVWSIGKGASS